MSSRPLSAHLEAFKDHLSGFSLSQAQSTALAAIEGEDFPSIRHEQYRHTPLLRRLDRQASTYQKGGRRPLTGVAPASTPTSTSVSPSASQKEGVMEGAGHHEAFERHLRKVAYCIELGATGARYDAPPRGVHIEMQKGMPKTLREALYHTRDPFAWANIAAAQTCLVIRIAPHASIQMPILIRYVPPKEAVSKAPFFYTAVSIELGEQARGRFIEHGGSRTHPMGYHNSSVRYACGKGARLETYILQDEGMHQTGLRYQFVSQAADSHSQSHTLSLGAGFQRNALHVQLKGPHSKAHLYGLQHADQHAFADNHTYIQHMTPMTTSEQNYRQLLQNHAKGVFSGRIHIHPHAQKTEAYQSQSSLLLAKQAAIHAQPQLEIYADDVRCSHGCTTQRIDPEQYFYLCSRGIPQHEAKQCLLNAFMTTILHKIPWSPMLHYLKTRLALAETPTEEKKILDSL